MELPLKTEEAFDALMAMPLYDGALDDVTGRYIEDSAYNIDSKEAEEFDKGFPPKEPAVLPPIKLLTDKLTENAKRAFDTREIRYISQLQGYSGVEILSWDGIEEQDLAQINHILKEYGQPENCFLLPYFAACQNGSTLAGCTENP